MSWTGVLDMIRKFRLGVLRPLAGVRASRARSRARGTFVGVTGSSGKSTTTALIAAILSQKGTVRSQVMDNTIKPLMRTLRQAEDADFVVAELGVGRSGQMHGMAALLRPDVSVVTMVGLEHRSAFRSSDNIAQEKGELVAATPEHGFTVLNADDPRVMGMAARTKAQVVTFGYGPSADCRIAAVRGGIPDGITVSLVWKDSAFEVPTKLVGPHLAIDVAAAAAVGLQLGLTPEMVSAGVADCPALNLRLSMHQIPNGPLIVADSAKAPQATLHLAFEALKAAPAVRRRIVLGTISDYAGDRRRVYKSAVRDALAAAHEVILINDSATADQYAPEAARDGRYRIFPSTRAAADYLAQSATADDVILLKGSANFHLERILLHLAGDVRCWEQSCGRGESCFRCGLSAFDHAAHRGIRRKRRWLSLWRPAGSRETRVS